MVDYCDRLSSTQYTLVYITWLYIIVHHESALLVNDMMTMVLRSCRVFTNEQWNRVEPPNPEVGWEVSWLRRLRAGQSSDHDSIRHGQVMNLGLWGETQFFLPWSQLDASGKAVLFSALATWLQWDKVVEQSFSDTWLSINGVPKERWISNDFHNSFWVVWEHHPHWFEWRRGWFGSLLTGDRVDDLATQCSLASCWGRIPLPYAKWI